MRLGKSTLPASFLPLEWEGGPCATSVTQKCSQLFPPLLGVCGAMRWKEPGSQDGQKG